MNKKWDRSAMRFASAQYLERQGMLAVKFEDGDHFLLAVESILPAESLAAAGRAGSRRASRPGGGVLLDWDKMRIGETGDVLEIPADAAVIEIPWDRIRSVADPEFRAHLADRAIEHAQRIGRRIQAMRQEAGLSPEALAEKVGVRGEVIEELESGTIEPRSELIEEIAIVLGKRLRDFAEE